MVAENRLHSPLNVTILFIINSFNLTNSGKQKPTNRERQQAHIEERRNLRRSAGPVMRHVKPIQPGQRKSNFRGGAKRKK